MWTTAASSAPMLTAAGLALGLAAVWALRRLLAWARLARLVDARFGGPPAWPLLGNIPHVGADHRYMMERLRELCEPYHPLGRGWVGPVPVVALADPRDIQVVMGSVQHVEKPFIYRFFDTWLGRGLITASKTVWRPHRRLLNPAFHSRVLAQFVPAFSQQTDTFLAGLARHADGPAFDILQPIDLLTLDVLCETAMGVRLGLQQGGGNEFAKAVKQLERMVLARGTKPWLYPDCLFRLSPLGRRWRRALAVVHGTRDRVLQARKAELERRAGAEAGDKGPGRLALLDLLLRESALSPAFSEQDVAHEVDTFMMAGHETTAFSLACVAFLLAANPAVQERAAAEVESVFGTGRAPDPSAEQLARLPYLDRVIKEALRLYPAVMLLVRQAEEDIPMATRDVVVPKGCMVGVSPYITHRLPHLFPDPERFDPDRWLPENSRDRHPYSYFPFSAGPRNCIGKRFAQLQMLCVLAKLLWRFQLLPEPGFELWAVWGVISMLPSGSVVRLRERRGGNAAV